MSGRRFTVALGVALFVSVAANFFLAGILLNRPEPRGRFLEQVPAADQAIVRNEFDSRRAALDPRRAELRAASKAVQDAFQAQPFDRAALEKAFAEMRRANSEYRAVSHEALAAAAAQASPEGRARLAEAPFLRRAGRERTSKSE